MAGSESLPGHDGGNPSPLPARTVATWPEGSFVENIAIDAAGAIFTTLHPAGELYRITPAGEKNLFATLPTPIAGLAFDRAGNLFVSAGTPGQAGGVIWRVAPGGGFARWLDLPDALFLNGVTPAPDGGMLVIDSLIGRIFHIGTAEPTQQVWLQDDRLKPLPGVTGLPGANGIKRFGGRYAISNTTRAQLFSVAEDATGLALLADRLRADDIAFDEAGALYCTTHMHHSLVRLSPNGARTTIAGPAQGMAGSTACAFGRTQADRSSLYVTTTGGVGAPFEGKLQAAKLVAIDVGVRGVGIE